jgi:transcription-repair coupling factor (superfamily II helicase)
VPHPILLESLRSTTGYRGVQRGLPTGGETLHLSEAAGAAPMVLLADLHREAPERPWIVVAPTPDEAESAFDDLVTLLGEEEAALYPQRETLPYEEGEGHVEISGQRVEALEAVLSGRVAVLVTTTRALQERTALPASVDALRLELAAGQEIRPVDLAEQLLEMGFEEVSLIEEIGQFARRGGIVDIFGFGADEPARLEFWGDEIESIRHFEILSQRSTRAVERLELLPVDFRRGQAEGASGAEGGRSLLSIFPDRALLMAFPGALDPVRFRETWREVTRLYDIERRRGRQIERPERLYLSDEEVSGAVARHGQVQLAAEDVTPPEGTVRLGAVPPEAIDRDLGRLGTLLREQAGAGGRTIVFCDNEGQRERLGEILEELGAADTATLTVGTLSGGFRLPGAHPPLRVLTDHEIFRRRRRMRRRRRFRGGAALESFAALKPGDYVVHMDHGIGQFRGMEQVRVGHEAFETMAIEYAGGELLRVPVHRVDLIERWVSDREDGAPPPVHRIGGKSWKKTRRKTERAIEEITAELVELYARREAGRGHAFSEDTRWQREMESSFLFEDTPDQRQAALDVKRDMERPRAMDRLVCGDVGYGKTEVAIRAAFKAVQDGKQVAVLVPTTILAQQHLQTFQERLADYPVRIDAISRFRTPAQQRETLAKLASGEVDIVVGTHRMLSKDVVFRDLGLIVVDEEQRFGVRHKERLKQLKATVDVLTLSATPIPRTLQMSLLGVRDMTVIETPPLDRQPIITHVVPWSDAILEEAIRRELDRGGQVFFVHNRVESISSVAERVRRLVPDARTVVAHGQMQERELEEAMTRFVTGERDVLVATSIIENGLDVPRANTLIVDRADYFGLAQLYQIRGRVGRSHHRAYCYLVVPDNVTDDAERRLRILEHHTELGSGHRIALKDLELRGAGNILGSEQSGFVHAVGFDTYMRMLEQAIRRLKEGDAEIEREPAEVTVEGAVYVPDSYMADEAQKLNFYRRLSRMREVGEVEALREEARDRYGPLPAPVARMLDAGALRLLGTALGIERIYVGADDAHVRFHEGVVPRMAALQEAMAGGQLAVEVQRTMPLTLQLTRLGPEPVADTLIRALRALDGTGRAAA